MPNARLVMFRVATPPETATVPIVVFPSSNLTLPVGVRLPTCAGEVCNVAVSTTCCPKKGVEVFVLKSVLVVLSVDCNGTVLEVLALKPVPPG